ncbi:MAG: hypothetical protein COB02_16130 [Candidatus Cloacimonadota bacterium]|nr:MAG: hypothetical protein COB02_16130 [Candidatus Cloacimonadota bacterium]
MIQQVNHLSQFKNTLRKIQWKLNNPPQFLNTHRHIIFKFSSDKKTFIYRKAKFSSDQIKRQVIANQLFKEYTPKILFYNDDCIIEEYIIGQNLHLNTEPHIWQQFSTILSNIHAINSSNYGVLKTISSGIYNSFKDFIKPDLQKFPIIYNQKVISSKEIKQLEEYILNPPPSGTPNQRVCHGDIWPANIIYNKKTSKITLIDWENISSLSPEYDLYGFSESTHPKVVKIYKDIKKYYNQPLNQELIDYYGLLFIVSRYSSVTDYQQKPIALNNALLSKKHLFTK